MYLNQKDQDKVISSVHPGAIILMHSAGGKDQREGTIKALPGIIKTPDKAMSLLQSII